MESPYLTSIPNSELEDLTSESYIPMLRAIEDYDPEQGGELIVGAVSNPYVLSLVAVSVWNTLNDPTTKGLGDSARAKSYTAPQ